ncbi:MAG: large conductance mechanosensitive channel protein MscL [Thermomicrobiales bacterium]
MRETLQDFKTFVLRGNVIDLAIAVVLGAAFGAVVTALVTGIFTPLIAVIIGSPDFSNMGFTIRDSKFEVGMVLNAVLSFVSVAAVIFLFVVKPMNLLIERTRRAPATVDPTTKKCDYCLSEIPMGASRCAFCTSDLVAASV